MNNKNICKTLSGSNNIMVTYIRKQEPPQVDWRKYYISGLLNLRTGIELSKDGCTLASSVTKKTPVLYNNLK